MTFHSCPNCGSSMSDAVGPPPAACPWCCASLRVEEDVPSAMRGAPERRPAPALHMPIESDGLAPSAARHALDTLRPELGEARYRVCELLVSELVTNVVRHTHGGDSGAEGDLSVRMYPDCVRVEVRDDGPGFMPAARGDDDDPGAGWGLFLVDELADDWGVESGGQNCVWFELTRTPVPSGGHAAPHHH